MLRYPSLIEQSVQSALKGKSFSWFDRHVLGPLVEKYCFRHNTKVVVDDEFLYEVSPDETGIFVSNHGYYDDITMSAIHAARHREKYISVIAKHSLFKSGFYAFGMRLGKAIPRFPKKKEDDFDGQAHVQNKDMLTEALNELVQQGVWVGFAGEGTRQTSGHALPFRKGPAQTYLNGNGQVVIPANITTEIFSKDGNKPVAFVRYGKPIRYEGDDAAELTGLMQDAVHDLHTVTIDALVSAYFWSHADQGNIDYLEQEQVKQDIWDIVNELDDQGYALDPRLYKGNKLQRKETDKHTKTTVRYLVQKGYLSHDTSIRANQDIIMQTFDEFMTARTEELEKDLHWNGTDNMIHYNDHPLHQIIAMEYRRSNLVGYLTNSLRHLSHPGIRSGQKSIIPLLDIVTQHVVN